MPFIGLEWLTRRTGAAASNHFEGGGFVRSNDEVDYPNLMFHFLPLAVRYDGQKQKLHMAIKYTLVRCILTHVVV